MRVLVVDDEPQIVEVVRLSFNMLYPEAVVLSAPNFSSGLKLVKRESLDIVILDIGLPDRSGFELLQEIRSFSSVPVIILTVRGGEADKVKGLEMGADDYITKPFSPLELQARVKAVLRRLGKITPEIVSCKGMSLDVASGELKLGDKEIKLTPIEARIMQKLMRHLDRPVSRKELISEIWGPSSLSFAYSSLKVHIKNLRLKLEKDPQKPEVLLTERGWGYKLKPPT